MSRSSTAVKMTQVAGCSDCREIRTSRAYVVRQKPLYHNCQLRSPDGQLLCTCDVKKAKWYIDKGLGGNYNYYYYKTLMFRVALSRTKRCRAT